MNYQKIIDDLHREISGDDNPGEVATYIPELAGINPNQFGVQLLTVNNESYSAGNSGTAFSIQSIAKVFSLALAYKHLGAELWERVDVEPSGNPFNSLVQLEHDEGIPRNPMINAGAIVICDILTTILDDPKRDFLDFVRQLSGNNSIDYDKKVAESEDATGFRNAALANFIRSFGNIKNDIDAVLDFYFHLCSLSMTCKELAESFLFLANNGRTLFGDRQVLTPSETKRINAIMLTCGFYDEAGEFTYRVGLPGKSGVGGGIAAVQPLSYSIAVWSPKLNSHGNSVRGFDFLERFTTRTGQSIF